MHIGAITSGALISIRAVVKGGFITVENWDDNMPFSFAKSTTEASIFRVVLASEVDNAEKSTSEGMRRPSRRFSMPI